MATIELLKEIMDKQKGTTDLEKIFHGVKTGAITWTRLRNASIIREFDRHSMCMSKMRAYQATGDSHCVTDELVRKVVANRELNKI